MASQAESPIPAAAGQLGRAISAPFFSSLSSSLVWGPVGLPADPAEEAALAKAKGEENLRAFAAEMESEADSPVWRDAERAFGGRRALLLRFLAARDGKIPASADMLRKTLEFREQFRTQDLVEDTTDARIPSSTEIARLWGGAYIGRTSDGSVVQLHRVGRLDPAPILARGEDAIKEFYVSWMEWGLALQRKADVAVNRSVGVNCNVEIYDCRGVAVGQIASLLPGVRVFARTLSIGQDNYPENLRVCYLLFLPSMISWVVNMVLSVLSEASRAKTVVSSGDCQKELVALLGEEMFQAIIHGPDVGSVSTLVEQEDNYLAQPRSPALLQEVLGRTLLTVLGILDLVLGLLMLRPFVARRRKVH